MSDATTAKNFPPFCERDASMIHHAMVDGRVKLCVFFGNDYFAGAADAEHIDSIIDRWYDPPEVGIGQHFWPSEILDSMIDVCRLVGAGDEETIISAEEKPTFDALRQELVSMIAKIDLLRYK